MMLRNKAVVFFFFLFCFPAAMISQKIDDDSIAFTFPIDAIKQFNTYEDLESFVKNENPEKIKIINFWATWCKPCVRELSLFELFNQKNRGLADVYLISLDKVGDIEKLSKFLGKREISTKVGLLLDKRYNEWIGMVNADWSGAIPATLVIVNGKKYFFEQEFEHYHDLDLVVKNSMEASKIK
jgi:thiol-disulfide isomerase/thioredoxin